MDNETVHERMRAAWGGVADGWGAQSKAGDNGQAAATDWLLSRTDPRPGEVVLDLAGGAGGLGRLAAQRVGPDGLVLATDFAPKMVEVARTIADEEHLTNIEFRVLDAQQMDLDDESVDVVLCRSGIMLMVDPGAALREVRRVLRDGGRLACSVFTTPEQNPWATTMIGPFVARGLLEPPEPGGPGMFALGRPGVLRALIDAAGFDRSEFDELDYTIRFADDDAVWNLVANVNALLPPILRGLDDHERGEIRSAVVDAYAPWRTADSSYEVPGRVLAALAR